MPEGINDGELLRGEISNTIISNIEEWVAELEATGSMDTEDGFRHMFLRGIKWAETRTLAALEAAGPDVTGTLTPADTFCLRCRVFGHAGNSSICVVRAALKLS